MNRQIILEALNGIRDIYIEEAAGKLGLLAVGAAAVNASGPVSDTTPPAPSSAEQLFSLSATEPAAKVGFGAWVAKGGWVALVAGALVAAGVAVGAFFLLGGEDLHPAESDTVTAADTEQATSGSTDTEGGTDAATESGSLPQEDLRHFRFPLTDPHDTTSYVSLPDSSGEGEPRLAFSTAVGEGNTLKEVFTLPIPTEGERNVLVMACEGILDPSYQTGSHYVIIYFIENTFVEEVDGIERRTVQMRCGQVDFHDTPMPVPSGGGTSYVNHHADKLGVASVTYSEADRSSVLARTRHDNQTALTRAEQLLNEYQKENYRLTVLYSHVGGEETVNTPVASLPNFPYELFRTYAFK